MIENRKTVQEPAAHLIPVSNGGPDAHESLAVALVKERRFEEADAAFCEALRLTPDNAQALNNYGVFLQEQGKYEQAVEQLRKAAELCRRAAATGPKDSPGKDSLVRNRIGYQRFSAATADVDLQPVPSAEISPP